MTPHLLSPCIPQGVGVLEPVSGCLEDSLWSHSEKEVKEMQK